jgi:GNAT superfamily N-acetyltransferase
MNDELTIRSELRVGDLGRIATLHGETYDPLGGYGLRFEAYVGQTVAEFVLGSDARGKVWLAERGGRLVGCAAIVLRDNDVGQLRWVVVDPAERGNGLGGRLVQSALAYCRDKGCNSIVLETTDGLPESQAMYEKLGFRTFFNEVEELWDGPRALIKMQLEL